MQREGKVVFIPRYILIMQLNGERKQRNARNINGVGLGVGRGYKKIIYIIQMILY
jgi:hypothetical protein